MFKYESIESYHAALMQGNASCEAAVTHFLDRISATEHLNAFAAVYAEEAVEKARQLDALRLKGEPLKKLHGVVVALKDVISYKDHPLSAASNILKNYKPVYNATVVDKLLAEDAIIIGNTNCDEFAMGSTNENSAHGKVLNAINEEHVPGGSSGGSAVAVQSGCCMVSLGSDTGGSVRQPADFCGIVGFKPTYGRISRYGLIAYASSFDQIGIFGLNIPDVGTILEVIAGPDAYDSTASRLAVEPYGDKSVLDKLPTRPLRIGYLKQAFESQALDKEIAESLYAFTEALKADGNIVEPIDFEYLDFVVPTYYILTTAEASSNLSRFDGIRYGSRHVDKINDLTEFYCQSRSEGFGWEVKRRIMLGTFVLSAGYYDAYFTKAQQVRRLLQQKTQMIFSSFDVLLLPTVPTTAFRVGEKLKDPIAMYMADIFTVFSNLTGLPGISIPLFWHSNRLPFGVQAMTNRFSDLFLLQLSNHWMQQYRKTGF